MKARLGMVLGRYGDGIAQAVEAVAVINALGVMGGVSALLNVLGRHVGSAAPWRHRPAKR
jgi:hypothetical protein